LDERLFYWKRGVLPGGLSGEVLDSLARYIIRASFPKDRTTYLSEPVESLKVERESRSICRFKDNRQKKTCQKDPRIQTASELIKKFKDLLDFTKSLRMIFFGDDISGHVIESASSQAFGHGGQ
jgi:hypothetical protein